jgi:hypothetical protein
MGDPAQDLRRDLRRRIRDMDEHPTTNWRPAPGDVLVGLLVDVDMRTTKYGPAPVLTIRDEDSGQYVDVWALHTVLRNELVKRAPRPGEKLAIRRLEDSDNGYKRYKVLVDREAGNFDWSQVSVDGGDVDPADRKNLELYEKRPQRAEAPASPFEADDDSGLPF